MARQLRWVVPGLAHLVSLPALPGLLPFPGAADRERFILAMREAAAAEPLQVHAYALLPHEVRTLATPGNVQAISRWMQAVGRRYVSAYNRLYGRAGTLWAGRFRCAPLQPGPWTLQALLYVDGAAAEAGATSAPERCGAAPRAGFLVDPPEYWSLGNTPFERESAYTARLLEPREDAIVARLQRSLTGGWICSDEDFAAQIAAAGARPARPGPRGRPRKT
jgi:putative transposase